MSRRFGEIRQNGYVVRDIEAAMRHWTEVLGVGRFVYFATEAHPGTVIELSEVNGSKGRFFAHVAQTSASWDGSEPVRRLGSR